MKAIVLSLTVVFSLIGSMRSMVQASFSMPLSVRAEEGRRPTIWGIGIGFSERTLKGIFAGDNDYYFSVSPYVSVGVKYNFGK